MSGRKPARTDYIYVVFAQDTLGPEDAAFRTFKSAKRHAKLDLVEPATTKVAPDLWVVASKVLPDQCFSVIGRLALQN